MDLNEIPTDNLGKSDSKYVGNLEDSTTNCSQVAGKQSRVVEEHCLALELEIRNKSKDLDAIRVRVRDLEAEKGAIENEIMILKKKKAVLEGVEFSLDDYWDVELSKVDQLMIENKVLECEKMSALKEVEVWKHKCTDLESRLVELQSRLPLHSLGADATHGKLQMEGPLHMETSVGQHSHVVDSQTGGSQHTNNAKKKLVFQHERRCDRKIAPLTPGAINIIDIDDEDEDNGIDPKSAHEDEAVGVMDLDDTTDCKDDVLLITTPKRKRGPKVVLSDDECEVDESTPTKRTFKIDDAENEDDSMSLRQAVNTNRVNGNGQSAGDEDDIDDNTPLSQLKRNRAEDSSQPIAKRTRSCSGHGAGKYSHRQTRPRRRLVKSQEEPENGPEMMTIKDVEDSCSSDDESDSEVDSLKSFIDDDSDADNVQDDVAEDGTDHSTEAEDSSDSNIDYHEIISRIGRRKRPDSEWELEADMLSDFGKDPELCMRAVCALYRQQTADEKRCKESIFQNGRGFSKFDASRGTTLGEFLTDGDANGNLVKTVDQLRKYDPDGVEACRRLANHYSKQLFEIYKNDEDPFFP